MKKIFKSCIIITLGIIFFTCCSKEFLEKKKLGEESSSTFYLSEDNAVAAVTACYHIMHARETFARDFWAFGDVASDDTEGGGERGGRDQLPCQYIDGLYQLIPSNAYISEFYTGIYRGIYNCNQVITNVPDATFDEAVKTRLIGEAKCLRAIYHWYLNIVYGGVPIVDHLLTDVEYFNIPRSSVAEVLHFVQDELSAVANDLPKDYGVENYGRTTSGTAKAYQLKALVFESSYAELVSGGKDPAGRFTGCENKWAEAWTVAQDIITDPGNPYVLEPDYANLWIVGDWASRTGDFSKEHVFKVNAVSALNQNPGQTQELLNDQIVSVISNIYQSCRSFYGPGGVPQETRNGWGLNAPTYELQAEYEPGDPRYKISIIHNNDTVYDITDKIKPFTTQLAAPGYCSPTRANSKKYDPEPDEWKSTSNQNGPLDVKMFRYADVLLLAAEAGLKTSHEGDALTYINQIRARARNSGNTGLPAPLAALDMNAVRHERRVELAMEAHRYFDIVRWGIAEDVLDGKIRATDTVWAPNPMPIDFIPGKHEFFPIPESQVVLSKGSIQQNPGY
jgi:hypothetical protein